MIDNSVIDSLLCGGYFAYIFVMSFIYISLTRIYFLVKNVNVCAIIVLSSLVTLSELVIKCTCINTELKYGFVSFVKGRELA